jgi:hypothetical protein
VPVNDAPRDGLVNDIELVDDIELVTDVVEDTWFGEPCAKLPDTNALDVAKTTPRSSIASATVHLLRLFIAILATLVQSKPTGFLEGISSSSPVLLWCA